jgi:predicted DNA-binding transcriptional regulator AlpA
MISKKYTGNQKRIAKQKQDFLEELKTIPIIQVVCERLSLGRATFYRWKEEDQEFSQQVDLAISQGDYLVNDLAESQLVTAVKDGSTTTT